MDVIAVSNVRGIYMTSTHCFGVRNEANTLTRISFDLFRCLGKCCNRKDSIAMVGDSAPENS